MAVVVEPTSRMTTWPGWTRRRRVGGDGGLLRLVLAGRLLQRRLVTQRADGHRAAADPAHPAGGLEGPRSERTVTTETPNRSARSVTRTKPTDSISSAIRSWRSSAGTPCTSPTPGVSSGVGDGHTSTQPPCGGLLKHSKHAVTDPLSKG